MKFAICGQVVSVLLSILLTACVLTPDRVVYEQQGITIGIQYDSTVNRATQAGRNSHPAQFTPEQISFLLGSLRVSGWSGSLMGFLVTPTAIPVFNPDELRAIAGPISQALSSAGPDERVFFTLPNQKSSYSDDRVTGALAIRGPYLHFVLTDHSAFTRGDTAGGEDPRDTKGMKLSVASPVTPALLTKSEEPHWGPYEKVHLSIAMHEVLAQGEASPKSVSGQPVERSNDLQIRVQELTTSNHELKKRLEEQAGQMADLQSELQKLQRELKKTRTNPLSTPPSP